MWKRHPPVTTVSDPKCDLLLIRTMTNETTRNEGPAPDPTSWGVSAEEAQQLLRDHMCPVCGRGPWQSPLNHVSRKHGIGRHTMRDICLLTVADPVTTPDLHERLRANRVGKDMSKVAAATGKSRRPKRLTAAGKQNLIRNLEHVTAEQSRAALALAQTPENRAKVTAANKARWAAMTPDERRAAAAQLQQPEAREKQHVALQQYWSRQELKPCGTRASYRRGCRCDECHSANVAYKRAHR